MLLVAFTAMFGLLLALFPSTAYASTSQLIMHSSTAITPLLPSTNTLPIQVPIVYTHSQIIVGNDSPSVCSAKKIELPQYASRSDLCTYTFTHKWTNPVPSTHFTSIPATGCVNYDVYAEDAYQDSYLFKVELDSGFVWHGPGCSSAPTVFKALPFVDWAFTVSVNLTAYDFTDGYTFAEAYMDVEITGGVWPWTFSNYYYASRTLNLDGSFPYSTNIPH